MEITFSNLEFCCKFPFLFRAHCATARVDKGTFAAISCGCAGEPEAELAPCHKVKLLCKFYWSIRPTPSHDLSNESKCGGCNCLKHLFRNILVPVNRGVDKDRSLDRKVKIVLRLNLWCLQVFHLVGSSFSGCLVYSLLPWCFFRAESSIAWKKKRKLEGLLPSFCPKKEMVILPIVMRTGKGNIELSSRFQHLSPNCPL